MVYVVYFLSVLLAVLFLVIVHELGHFLAARAVGVKATEFFVGFGPRLWSFRKGDTEYGIKALLVGGYVKILGMNPEEEVKEEDLPHSYRGVLPWKKTVIVLAGSLSHVLLALLIMFMTIWLIGIPDPDQYTTTIAEVGKYMNEEQSVETPAYQAGLEKGDRILSMDGEAMEDWDDVRSFIIDHPNEEVTLVVDRNGERLELTVTLAEREGGGGYLGVSPLAEMEHFSFTASLGETIKWFGAATYGVAYGIYRIFSWSTFKQLLGLSEPTADRPVTVVGISRMAGQFAGYGAFYFLNFFSFILLFLAYMNLLPLPPLDGGHLLVILVEKITGREIDLRRLYPVAVAVLAFFTVLFLLTLRLDITNPVNLP
jgi:membrane-associated protease RseP (regulator of RpoE activity)